MRPARIYGPFSRTFTVRPLQALREGRLVLSGDADSPSNMVYVDNVVEAILKALVAAPTEHGEAFLISEPDQLSWGQFYQFFAAPAGATIAITPYPTPAPPPGGLGRALVHGTKQILTSSELRGLVKKVMSTDPVPGVAAQDLGAVSSAATPRAAAAGRRHGDRLPGAHPCAAV